ncbi:MAG: TrmB family transcriptional regulator [Chloroflexota bacterium]|nr:TrmB family transcriptional regulator [Chloroflexota bacterium]
MKEPSTLADQLAQLGLTTYEAKAYVALLGRGSFTAAQVARHAGLPRQRIYDVLSSLVQKGLAAGRPGKVVKYAAAAPDVAIERLLTVRRRGMADLERTAAALVEELTPAYRSGQEHTDPLEYIELLRDRGAINERFAELQASVKDEILVFTKPPYAQPPQANVEGLEVTRAHRARAVYEWSVFEDPAVAEGVRHFIQAGEEARFVESLPLKLVIIDEEIVMFGMEDPVASGGDLTIMVVEHPALATVLKSAFNFVWDAGLTFEEAHDRFLGSATGAEVASAAG